MAADFIDIHTHKTCREGTVCIQNLIVSNLQDTNDLPEDIFSCGFHPWYLTRDISLHSQLNYLREIALHPRCVAIGEAGLDKLTTTDWLLQEEVFIMQIELASALQKPLIIHCVKAFDEILRLKKQFMQSPPWIIHGFNSSPEMAEQLLQHDILLSFGKQMLNKNSRAHHVLTMLKPNNFFLETDDDDVCIEDVYEAAAQLRNEDPEEMKNLLQRNFNRIFRFTDPLSY